MKTFLLYLFQISFWIAQLAIIAFVFSYLETRIELIVVSILGLLYTAVRGEALFSSYARVHYAIASHKDLTRILELIGERHEIIEERRKEAEKAQDWQLSGHRLVTSIFLGLISLMCLYILFSTLLSPS